MSFGFSVGDFVAVIQLAKTTYKNCVEAGAEYNEIARQIRSLHSVLKPLRDEAEKPDSGLFRQDQGSAAKLKTAIDGCQHILEDLQILLAKYEGLSTDGEAVSAPKKLWHRFRFSTKIEQLGVVRVNLIGYTSTISVLLDGVQLRATGRVEEKLDNVSSQITDGFESLKKAILGMAVKARAEQRGGSTMSLLSLSTYAEDDKEVWREFRRELIGLGFRSKALDRHKDLLRAYMLKLDESGLLDEVKGSSGQNIAQPWWQKHAFVETVNSLQGLQPISEEEPTSQLYRPEESNASPTPPPSYSVNDANKDISLSKVPLGGKPKPYNPELYHGLELPPREETDLPVPKETSLVEFPDVGLAGLPGPTDSEESEKETTVLKRPQRARTKRKSDRKGLNADSAGAAADIVTEKASETPLSPPEEIDENVKPINLEGLMPIRTTHAAPNIIAEVPSNAARSPPKEKDEQERNISSERLPPKRVDIQTPDAPPPHAAKSEIDTRSGQLYGDPLLSTSIRGQTEPSSTSLQLQPTPIPGPGNPQSTLAAAKSKDAVQTPLHDSKSEKSPQGGTTLLPPGPQEPVEIQQIESLNKVAQNLHQLPSRLATEADIPEVSHVELGYVGEVAKAARDSDQRANRRRQAPRDPKDKSSTEQFLHRVKHSFPNSTLERGRIYSSTHRTRDPIGHAQSPKSRRAAARAVPARPALNQTYSDPISRIGPTQKAQIQERSKGDTGNRSSTGSLGAVALGLAGLSMILGLRRRSQTRETRGRRGYVSDSYESYYDTYDSISSDFEDDGDIPSDGKRKTKIVSSKNWHDSLGPLYVVTETVTRKKKDGAKDEGARPSDVSNTVPKATAIHAGLGASQENQYWQSATTGKQPPKEEPKEEPKTSLLDDDWGFGTTKKDKEKGKVVIEEVTKVEEPVVAEEEDADDWGIWGLAKKDKRKNAKAKEESPEPIVESTALAKVLEPAADDEWFGWVSLLVSLVSSVSLISIIAPRFEEKEGNTSKALVEVNPEETLPPSPPPPPPVPELGDTHSMHIWNHRQNQTVGSQVQKVLPRRNHLHPLRRPQDEEQRHHLRR
jgi:hypothetical protein